MPKVKLVEMMCHLAEQPQQEIILPAGFEIKSLADINQDDLYPCYCAAFQAGDSQLFIDQSQVERREFFDTLGFDQARNEPGSSMILKDNQIVGFTYVIPYGKANCHISCMCVHPNFQRQGLGSLMLNHVKARGTSQGYQTITLWTERTMGAFQLYDQHSFKITEEKEL